MEALLQRMKNDLDELNRQKRRLEHRIEEQMQRMQVEQLAYMGSTANEQWAGPISAPQEAESVFVHPVMQDNQFNHPQRIKEEASKP